MSGESTGDSYDVTAVTKDGHDSGVPHGEALVRLVDAVAGDDDDELAVARQALIDAMGLDAVVDTAGVIATFNQMDRIADATGIPLDAPLEAATTGLREDLGVGMYASAANTPAAGLAKRALARAFETLSGPLRWRIMRMMSRL